jgi:RNA polymerase sigma factor (sigma-70 family)
MRTTPATSLLNDAQLVELSRDGDRDAFARIVERYQSLISGLTYSACGNLQASEDLAQVTFITAWCQLRNLREPAKLKSWLCRIARNATVDSFRQQQRTPTARAETLDTTAAIPADASTPRDHAISREEEAILWRSLGELPTMYREPLVLFYRQHQSVAEVADALDVTEDVIRQRLSRGRAMLAEQVTAFVEGALQRTAPGREFSGAVLAALPLAAGPAVTAGLGAGAKGTAAAKSGFLAVWVAPFIGIAAGIVAQWLIICATTTDRKLRVKAIALYIVAWIVLLGTATAGPNALISLRHHFNWNDRVFFVAMVGFWWVFTMFMCTLGSMGFRRILSASQRSEEAGATPRPATTPMKPSTLAVVVAGTHLMLFSWLVRLAWRADDRMAAGITAGMMVALAIGAFFNIRGRTGAALARAVNGHMAVCAALTLATFNLRLDVWLTSGYGVSVAEIHRLLPTWIVPVLSLALVIWGAVVGSLTKPKRHAQ